MASTLLLLLPEKSTRILRQARTAFVLSRALIGSAPDRLRQFKFPKAAERLLEGLKGPLVTASAYDDFVRYMALSWAVHRNRAGSGAVFSGHPSWSGRKCDVLEGFSRVMPLFAAWCASGRDPTISFPGGSLCLPVEFKRGLLAGTDPTSKFYWGEMPGRSNQRIVEAADVALALWLMRDSVWADLTSAERDRVADWLSLADGKPGLDNNWHLFFVLIDRVLSALGYPAKVRDSRLRFQRVKEFHVGDGWFSDGPGGHVDYYNAWGFHYALAWINRIDRGWDPEFIDAVQRKFLRSYRLMIGPKGFPIFGRSIPYRLAAPAPLVAAVEDHGDIVGAGEARRGLDVIWRYFVCNGAIRRGSVTQGYYGPDMRLVDPYSGPASSFWSLRSLVMAFYYPPDHQFWTAAPAPLPVEVGDFDVCIASLGWRVTGSRATAGITVEILNNPTGAQPAFEKLDRVQNLRCYAGIRQRPANLQVKYGLRTYCSRTPFFEKRQVGTGEHTLANKIHENYVCSAGASHTRQDPPERN